MLSIVSKADIYLVMLNFAAANNRAKKKNLVSFKGEKEMPL
jgi:hypothetical protein